MTRWVLAPEAETLLTRRADRVQLLAVIEAWEEGTLRTFPLAVLRHGHARPKASGGRPMPSARSCRRAARQAAPWSTLLAAWAPARVVS